MSHEASWEKMIKNRSSHAIWTFVRARRVASCLAKAPLDALGENDWIYPGDRLVVSVSSLYVPSWLKHDADMYTLCSFVWKFVPDVSKDASKPLRDRLRERILLPFRSRYPYLAEKIQSLFEY